MDVEDLFPEIIRSVKGCDEPTMQDALIRAARIFCRRTWYVRREVSLYTSPPPAPTGVAAVAGNDQVTLTWKPAPNATAYFVNQGTASGHETPGNVAITGTSAVIAGLTNGTPYFFTVTAANGPGNSSASSEVTATPNGSATNTPASPLPAPQTYAALLLSDGLEDVIDVRYMQCRDGSGSTWAMGPATAADMDPKRGAQRPRAYAFTPPNQATLYPVPNGVYTITALCPVQPKKDGVWIPDELALNYDDCIGSGALEWILNQRGDELYDPQQAAVEGGKFYAGISRAKAEAIRDMQQYGARVQAAPFIARRRW